MTLSKHMSMFEKQSKNPEDDDLGLNELTLQNKISIHIIEESEDEVQVETEEEVEEKVEEKMGEVVVEEKQEKKKLVFPGQTVEKVAEQDKKPPNTKQGKYEKAMEDLRVKYMPKG